MSTTNTNILCLENIEIHIYHEHISNCVALIQTNNILYKTNLLSGENKRIFSCGRLDVYMATYSKIWIINQIGSQKSRMSIAKVFIILSKFPTTMY